MSPGFIVLTVLGPIVGSAFRCMFVCVCCDDCGGEPRITPKKEPEALTTVRVDTPPLLIVVSKGEGGRKGAASALWR